MPQVSILLPMRNAGRYAKGAIDSILGQSERDIEVLIVDDGSSDGTEQIIDEYTRRDGRVRAFRQPGLGLVAALELGRANATAPYIARMDGDDISTPRRIERQLGYLRDHPEVVVLGGQVELIDDQSVPLGKMPYPVSPQACQEYLAFGSPHCHPAVVMRADALAECGGYRAMYANAEDYDLWLRMAKRGRLANLHTIVLQYRVHDASVTTTRAHEQALATALALIDANISNLEFALPAQTHSSWSTVEPQLPPSARLYGRMAYIRALCLNGGIVEPEYFEFFLQSFPELRDYAIATNQEKMLAFAMLRATYQFARKRRMRSAARLASTMLRGIPLASIEELRRTVVRRSQLKRPKHDDA